MKLREKQKPYIFIDKTLFFPEQGILVIGDLHIGYEYALMESGILLPEMQVKGIIEDLEKIIQKINKEKNNLKKIIFLGDIKHLFSYEWKEKANFKEVLKFLGKYVPENKIIFIRGNHDTIDFTYGSMVDYYIDSGIAFVHGHQVFPEIFDKKIGCIISGHLHPSVRISEKPGIKKEIYKCFLEGSSRGKTCIILPSFLDFTEGTLVNDYDEDYFESFSIIPKKDIMKFRVYVIGKDKTFDFGKIRDIT